MLKERGSGKKGLKRILPHNRWEAWPGVLDAACFTKGPQTPQPSTDFYMMKNKGVKSK